VVAGGGHDGIVGAGWEGFPDVMEHNTGAGPDQRAEGQQGPLDAIGGVRVAQDQVLEGVDDHHVDLVGIQHLTDGAGGEGIPQHVGQGVFGHEDGAIPRFNQVELSMPFWHWFIELEIRGLGLLCGHGGEKGLTE
jgi:hypothetical protein